MAWKKKIAYWWQNCIIALLGWQCLFKMSYCGAELCLVLPEGVLAVYWELTPFPISSELVASQYIEGRMLVEHLDHLVSSLGGRTLQHAPTFCHLLANEKICIQAWDLLPVYGVKIRFICKPPRSILFSTSLPFLLLRYLMQICALPVKGPPSPTRDDGNSLFFSVWRAYSSWPHWDSQRCPTICEIHSLE